MQGVSLLSSSKDKGHIALHWAVLSRSQPMVSFVLQAMKAKHLPLTLENKKGKTAQALAANNPELVALFK